MINLIKATYQLKKQLSFKYILMKAFILFIMRKELKKLDHILLEKMIWSDTHEETMYWARLSINCEIVRRLAIQHGCY
ncbi:hypothetical protein AAW12_08675 [Sphingobacterium sp. Ag1]|nr:hypothetical protein AAW12_08675 [Sphingobacterium sp. Ag1]